MRVVARDDQEGGGAVDTDPAQLEQVRSDGLHRRCQTTVQVAQFIVELTYSARQTRQAIGDDGRGTVVGGRVQLDAGTQQPRRRQCCQRLAEYRLRADQHGVKFG